MSFILVWCDLEYWKHKINFLRLPSSTHFYCFCFGGVHQNSIRSFIYEEVSLLVCFSNCLLVKSPVF